MPGIGGSCPTIHLDIEFLPEGEKLLGDALCELDRLDPALLSGLLDLLPMLIDSGQEKGRPTKRPMISGDDVGQDLLRLQAGSAIKSNGDRCRVHIIDGADHVFSQRPARRRLLQLLTSELPQ